MVRVVMVALMWLMAASSWAATVAGVSPQGKVSVVESVKITFDSAVIAFGDAQAMAPAKVTCGDPGIKGSGRWLDPKRWTYVFHAKLDRKSTRLNSSH